MSNVSTAQPSPQAPPQELSPLELRVFVGHIQGWPVWRIAMNTGISEAAVRTMMARPRFQAAVSAATASVIAHGSRIATRISELALPAVERLAYLMSNAKSEQVQFQSSRDVLDRAGYKPTERIEHTTKPASSSFNLATLTPDEREKMRELALKAARGSLMGSMVDEEGLDPAIDITDTLDAQRPLERSAQQPLSSDAQQPATASTQRSTNPAPQGPLTVSASSSNKDFVEL